jgi:hypothetical protein
MEMSVPGQDIFLAVIDLSLALIGFSSIVTALRRSKDKSWSQQEINGLVFLAGMAIGAIIFALLPFALYYMDLGQDKIYQTASLVYVIFAMLVALALFIRSRSSGYPSRRPKVFNTFTLLSLIPIVMLTLLAAGRITQGVMGVYLLGLFWLLILAFIQFLMFLSFVGFVQEGTPDDILA